MSEFNYDQLSTPLLHQELSRMQEQYALLNARYTLITQTLAHRAIALATDPSLIITEQPPQADIAVCR